MDSQIPNQKPPNFSMKNKNFKLLAHNDFNSKLGNILSRSGTRTLSSRKNNDLAPGVMPNCLKQELSNGMHPTGLANNTSPSHNRNTTIDSHHKSIYLSLEKHLTLERQT